MNDRIRIRNIEPQEIVIDGAGTPSGITNVYVNGVDVTVGSKAYVIVPTKLSELTNDEGFITAAEETDPTVPYYVKEITVADINNWNDKQDALVSGTTIKTINGNSILGSGNLLVGTEYTAGTGIEISGTTINNTITSYNDLTDLPSIPTNTSDLVNDSGFITNKVDDLVNYIPSSLLEKILPQVSESGTELYLDNTVNYNLKFKLDPHEIEQHTTTGAQLFDKTAEPNNTNYYINNSGSLVYSTNYNVYKIYLNQNTDYTLSGIINQYSPSICFYDENDTFLSGTNYNGNTSITVTSPNDTSYALVTVGIKISDSSYNLDTFMIEEGSTASTYEEYTGGQPSPNPDYPQIVHVNSGENTISVIGKNLFDKDNATILDGYIDSTKIISDGMNKTTFIKCLPDTTYTISKTPSKRFAVAYTTTEPTYNTSIYGRVTGYELPSITITTGNDAEYLAIWLINSNMTGEITLDEALNTLQIERGSSATTYVPYQEQVYPIDLTDIIDLVSINTTWGKYENFIYRNTLDSPFYDSNIELNSLQLGNRVYKTVLNSTDNWQDSGGGTFYVDISPNPYFGSTKRFAVSSHFLDQSLATDTVNESWILCLGFTLYIHFAPNLSISTLSDLTTWLENNTITVYAIRGGLQDTNAEPTDISYFYPELAEQYINLTEHSTAYEGGTSIFQENDDLPFELEASTFEKINN